MKKIFRRIKVNQSYIFRFACKWTAAIYAVLGFVGTFASLDVCVFLKQFLSGNEPSTIICILGSVAILLLIFIIFFFCALLRVIKKQRYELMEVSDGYHVYVQYGDIFSPDEVNNPAEQRNIIIPVNRCFDTKIDNDLVSSKSLHGVCMRRLYEKGLFTEETLSEAIQNFLDKKVQVKPKVISRSEKGSGNLKRYPAGTVAEIKVSEKCTYFFLALSWLDRNLHANTSDEEYVVALVKLLKWCNIRSQKYPIVMPLIGAGASDLQKNEKDILDYLIKLIQLNKNLINSDIHIVIRSSGKDSIGISGL